MTNTILDTFSVKYSFPHFTFLFNCSLQKQEQQIGGVATVHLSNLKNVILSINTRHALFKHCAKCTILKKNVSHMLKQLPWYVISNSDWRWLERDLCNVFCITPQNAEGHCRNIFPLIEVPPKYSYLQLPLLEWGCEGYFFLLIFSAFKRYSVSD